MPTRLSTGGASTKDAAATWNLSKPCTWNEVASQRVQPDSAALDRRSPTPLAQEGPVGLGRSSRSFRVQVPVRVAGNRDPRVAQDLRHLPERHTDRQQQPPGR